MNGTSTGCDLRHGGYDALLAAHAALAEKVAAQQQALRLLQRITQALLAICTEQDARLTTLEFARLIPDIYRRNITQEVPDDRPAEPV